MDKKTDKYLSSSEDYMYTMSHNDDDIDTYDGRDSRSSSMGGQPSRDTEILAPSLIAASARTNNNNNNDDNNAMEHVNKIRTKLTQWKPLHTITSHSHYQYSPPSSPTSAKARGRDNGNNNDNTNNSNLIRAHGTDIARDSSLSQLSGSGYDNVLPSSKTRSKHHYHSKGILRSIVCINNRGKYVCNLIYMIILIGIIYTERESFFMSIIVVIITTLFIHNGITYLIITIINNCIYKMCLYRQEFDAFHITDIIIIISERHHN